MTTALVTPRVDQSELNTDDLIVIPVVNEDQNVLPLVFGLPDIPEEDRDEDYVEFPGLHKMAIRNGKHLVAIFVDDSDNGLTGDAIKTAQHLLDEECAGFCPHLTIVHEHRTGDARTGRLAGAVRHGSNVAITAYGAKKIIVMDGDLQHNPLYLTDLLDALNNVDLVATTRYHKDGNASGLSNLYRKLVSRGATWLVKGLHPYALRKVSDPMTGYYGFRSDRVSLDKLNIVGFKILFATLRDNPKLSRASVPFKFGKRQHGDSKGDLKEGIDFLKQVIEYRLRGNLLNFLVGGGIIGTGGIYLLDWLIKAGTNAQAAYSIMLAVTVAANFAWNRGITWRGHGKTRLHQQIGAFVATRAATLGGSWLAFWLFVSHLGAHYQIVNISCMLLSTVVNYISSKRIFGI